MSHTINQVQGSNFERKYVDMVYKKKKIFILFLTTSPHTSLWALYLKQMYFKYYFFTKKTGIIIIDLYYYFIKAKLIHFNGKLLTIYNINLIQFRIGKKC